MELFRLLGTIAINGSEARKEIEDTTGKASDSSGKITGAFKKIGVAVATYFTVDAIKKFGLGCIQAAADANAMESQFSQVFGNLEGKAGKSLTGIADKAGISENRMKGSFTKIAAFAKTTGMDTESALGLSERAMIAVADSAAFYDRSLEETTESLQSFLKGNYENDAALGLSCTEVTRNAAANKLYGKSFKDLSEEQKQLTLLQMVEDANKASGAIGQAARESDTWTNVTGNLKQSWTDFQAVVGANVLPVAVDVVKKMVGWVQNLSDKVPSIVEKFSAFKQKASELGDYIGGKLKPIFDDLKAGFDAVKSALQPVIDAVKDYFTSGQAASDVTNNIKDAVDLLASAYEKISGFVTAVVNGFKDAYEWGQKHETGLALIATAVGTLTAAVVAYNVAQAIKNAGGIAEIAQLGILQVQLWALSAAQAAQTVATTVATAATSAFGAVMAFVTSPITLVIAAIGALIAIGVLLYKNWDTVKAKCTQFVNSVKTKFNDMKKAVTEKFNSIKSTAVEKVNSMKSSVVNKFNEIKNGISDKINGAKDKVKSAIDKIKGFFNFKWSLPKLKLPHFSIKGKFSLNPPSVPKLSVSWYKKAMDNAMILNSPTIFGYSAASGKFLGGGEAGSEVVAGSNTLMNMIEAAVATQNEVMIYYLQKIIEILSDYFPQLLDGFKNMKLVTDDGTIIAYYAPKFDDALGRIKNKKDRGR